MVHLLMLRQVGLFKMIIRQTRGGLHQRSSGIVILHLHLNLIGPILLSLRLIRLAFGGRLWVYVGRGG